MLHKKGHAGAILINLSKAFDTIIHALLLTKLDAYGFSKEALKLTFNYLDNTKQRLKINKTFSSSKKLLSGVPEVSLLGPILSIYI